MQFADARTFGPSSLDRNVTLQAVSNLGGGRLSRNEDSTRAVIVGREVLRVIRVSSPLEDNLSPEPWPISKFSVGPGGFKAEASSNWWKSSGLKIDSAFTDVCCGAGPYAAKIITSSRNGEMHLWDLGRASVKIERKHRPHTRSINALSYSPNHVTPVLISSGSQDGSARIWDLRTPSTTLRYTPPSGQPVRSLVLIPGPGSGVGGCVLCGVDNGSIVRFDLRSTKVLDRIMLAHNGPVTSLDFRPSLQTTSTPGTGYLASAGLDKCVKIWDIPSNRSNPTPVHTLHPSFPLRRVQWRHGAQWECEVAVVSADEGADNAVQIWDVRREWVAKWGVVGEWTSGVTDITFADESTIWAHAADGSFSQLSLGATPPLHPGSSEDSFESFPSGQHSRASSYQSPSTLQASFPPDSSVNSSTYWSNDSSAMLGPTAAHIKLYKPLDSISRSALSWDVNGVLAFAIDAAQAETKDAGQDWVGEIPYDDILNSPHKSIASQPYEPATQTTGMIGFPSTPSRNELEYLALNYKIPTSDTDESRQEVCAWNAEISTGRTSQIWSIINTLLTTYKPPPSPSPSPSPPLSPHPITTIPVQPVILGSAYNSPVISRNPSILPPDMGRRNSVFSAVTLSSKESRESSPRLTTHELPIGEDRSRSATHSQAVTPRRRASISPVSTRRSVYESPANSNRSTANKSSGKVVARGALDDSDSSDEDQDELEALVALPETALISPPLNPPHTSSPLRNVLELYAEDDDPSVVEDSRSSHYPRSSSSHDLEEPFEESPPASPTSSSSGSDGSSSVGSEIRFAPMSGSDDDPHDDDDYEDDILHSPILSSFRAHHRRKRKNKNNRPFMTQHSSSSTQTVTVSTMVLNDGSTPTLPIHEDHKETEPPQTVEERPTDNDITGREDPMISSKVYTRPSASTTRREKPQPQPPHHPLPPSKPELEDWEIDSLARQRRDIDRDAARMKELAWNVVREYFQVLADEGDVQLCAYLALTCSKELNLEEWQQNGFVNSYLDLLNRLQLYVACAHFRQTAASPSISGATQMQTTFHTLCGHCASPLSTSLHATTRTQIGFCPSCRLPASQCSICSLPVRGLRMHCGICNHGGHHRCYRDHIRSHPPVEVDTRVVVPEPQQGRGRTSSILNSGVESRAQSVERSLQADANNAVVGWLCPSGCGHICFARSAYV